MVAYYKKERETQAAVDAWNKTVSIGDDVTVRLGDGQEFNTRTASKAMISSAGVAVIWVAGIKGPVIPLENVRVATGRQDGEK